MFRLALVLAPLALFAFLPPAAAQAATTVSLEFQELNPRASTNASLYVEPFRVEVVANNIVCTGGASFTVALTPSAPTATAPSNATNATVGFSLTPASPSIAVPAGPYVAQPFRGNLEVTLQIEPSSIPYGGWQVPVSLRGQTSQTGCQGNGGIPSATQTQEFTVHFRRGTEPAPVTPTPAMPGPGPFLVAFGLLGALLMARRRRA